MLTIILIDSELETIPEEMWADPAVRKYSQSKKKSPQKILLDSNFLHSSIDNHFPAMSKRRGRPDIFYTFLNVVNESILNSKRLLRILVHTRNNKVLHINPNVRFPKSYNRFTGLMEDLFLKGKISSGDETLLSIENLNAAETVRKYSKGKTILMHPNAKLSKPEIIVADADVTLVVGGFAEGDFNSDLSFIDEKYSISNQELTIWTVASELICAYERVHDVL